MEDVTSFSHKSQVFILLSSLPKYPEYRVMRSITGIFSFRRYHAIFILVIYFYHIPV